MPLVTSNYSVPLWFFNHHLETILPGLFRKVNGIKYERERITTPDNDFLDLDWCRNGNTHLIIICHGLEGSSNRPYMMGMAKIFAQNGYDALSWNFRGCSGEPNLTERAYHSGATDDLQVVIDSAIDKGYKSISLIGFSLGGNIVLKYIGEKGTAINSSIKSGVALSVPLHLHSSCLEINKPNNILYAKRFLRNLKNKVVEKSKLLPDKITLNGINDIKTIIDFDDHYTAPIHGFKNAIDYYEKCSSLYFLNEISIPTLIINAENDSFLSEKCYPIKIAESHSHVHLEIPKKGGHCGFPGKDKNGYLWSEKRALEFIENETNK